MNRVPYNGEKSGFQKNFEKKLSLYILIKKSSYSWTFLLVIKVQLQLDFLISVSRGRCGFRKTEKIFSANNEQGTIKRGEKWFPEKL